MKQPVSKETAEVRVVRKYHKLYKPLIELVDALQFLEPGGTLVNDVKFAEYPYGFGASDGTVSLWVFKVQQKYNTHPFHRKALGINHFAFRVTDRNDVDDFYKNYLLANGIKVLYGGPAEHPEYEPGYYAVYFEDPDRIKLEVVYKP